MKILIAGMGLIGGSFALALRDRGIADEILGTDSSEENAAEAFAEAARQDHSVYDMFYLTLVRRNAATLFSADKKLVALCEEMKLDCVAEEPL